MQLDTASNLANEFKKNQKVLIAIGNETRQAILITLIQGQQNPGMRVGEIREKSHLSRPAVSHHLKILKEAGIVSVLKKGTLNYYKLSTLSKLQELRKLVQEIENSLIECNNHSG